MSDIARQRSMLAARLVAERFLDFVPSSTAVNWHYRFQRRFGKVGALDSESIRAELARGMGAMRFAVQCGFKFPSRTILELGTGWHAADVLLFVAAGAEVHTVDHLRHLDPSLVRRALDCLEESEVIRGELAELIGDDRVSVDERVSTMSHQFDGDLESIKGVTYDAPASIVKVVEDRTYDMFYSYSVLQRLPAPDLAQVFYGVRNRIRSGGCFYHVIHHTDHFARHELSVGPVSYLSIPSRLYRPIQSRRFNYQNRLRHSDMLRLLLEVGLVPRQVAVERLPASCLDGVRLAREFRSYDASDLLVKRTQVFATRAADA